MVDLGGGQDGPIEHGFSNSVFILPGIVFVSLSVPQKKMEDEIINTPHGDHKLPSAQELLAALEQINDLDEATKQELKESILRGAAEEARQIHPPLQEAIAADNTFIEIAMLLTLISLVLLVLFFFGYKLYKSLVDRERRKEEKKRQKQQKKKK